MTKKRRVDANRIIFNNIIDSVKPSKALWFPVVIIELCTNVGVEVTKNERKSRKGICKGINRSTINWRTKDWVEILEELKEIKILQEKLVTFMKC